MQPSFGCPSRYDLGKDHGSKRLEMIQVPKKVRFANGQTGGNRVEFSLSGGTPQKVEIRTTSGKT
jgi:hypothetical protein